MCQELARCEDRACDAQWEARFRRLKRKFEGIAVPSSDFCAEVLEVIGELKPLMEKKQLQMAEIYVMRLEALAETAGRQERQDNRMGLLAKIGSLLGGKKDDPEGELLRTQTEDAKQKIFQLQKKIAEISEERSGLMAEFEQKLKECAGCPADSYEYKLTRQQAQSLRKRIGDLENELKLYASLLQKNEAYHSMLKNGETAFELRNYMPDSAEADLLMQKIAEETQDIAAEIASFGESVENYGGMLDAANPSDVFGEDPEFDRKVQEMREEARKGAPAETPEAVKPDLSEAAVPEADPKKDKKTEKEWE